MRQDDDAREIETAVIKVVVDITGDYRISPAAELGISAALLRLRAESETATNGNDFAKIPIIDW